MGAPDADEHGPVGSTTVTAERVLTREGWRNRCRILVRDGLVTAIDDLAPGEPAEHRVLAPGFVDVQVNGVDDVDVATADGSDWDRLDALLARQGTTTWLPTLTTRPLATYAASLDRIARAIARPGRHPTIAGVHLEGPFLGRAHGAHPSSAVIGPDDDFIARLPDHVRLVTLGAETPRADTVTRRLVERGIVVAIGHSEPTEAEIDAVVECGATLVTHLFNAMSGIHHRRAGLALYALTDERLHLSLIADGVHVSRRAMALVWRARRDGVVLVTDAVAWNAPQSRLRVVDGAPRLADGTLAGSCLTMDAAVRNSVVAGADLADALVAASTRPARLLGLEDRGEIAVGQRADLVALDDTLHVQSTWCCGSVVHRRTPRR